jgi:hypothetical protein
MSAIVTDADRELPRVPADDQPRRLPYPVRMALAITACVVGLAVAVMSGGYVLQSRFQQRVIDDQAAQLQAVQDSSDCKSQLAAVAEAQLFRSTVKLLDTVERLANHLPIDLAEIDDAKVKLDAAANQREQVVAACQALATSSTPGGPAAPPPEPATSPNSSQETP